MLEKKQSSFGFKMSVVAKTIYGEAAGVSNEKVNDWKTCENKKNGC